jgi:hypothetical protein
MYPDEAHHAAVNEFFRRVREEDPERYAEVVEGLGDYPVMTANKHRTIRQRERTVGLLGMAASHIAPSVAEQFGFESVYTQEETY